MTSKEESDNKDEAVPPGTGAALPPAGADGPAVRTATALPGAKPDRVTPVAGTPGTTTARVEGKPAIPAEKPSPVAAKPESSLPVSMVVRPDGSVEPSSSAPPRRFPGELTESFETALSRVEPLPSGSGLSGIWRRIFSPALSRAGSRTRRVVAFDGFRSDLYDEKLERDRRYGTVYTVFEQKNAYLVRLEMPRRLASSALRATWNMPGEMPDYDYTIALENNLLTVKASVPGEALRRLSYISTSFPADFMTRIEFSRLVDGFIHRLRDKVLEIIVFKSAGDRDTNQTAALQP